MSPRGLPPVLQERLSRQQRDMEEERSRLQEVIAKMEARLGEQSRLLEQPLIWQLHDASAAAQAQSSFSPRAVRAPRPLALQRHARPGAPPA